MKAKRIISLPLFYSTENHFAFTPLLAFCLLNPILHVLVWPWPQIMLTRSSVRERIVTKVDLKSMSH